MSVSSPIVHRFRVRRPILRLKHRGSTPTGHDVDSGLEDSTCRSFSRILRNHDTVLPRRPPRLRIVGALATILLCVSASLPAGEVIQAKFVLAWGESGDKPGEFHSPIGLAMNQRDELFVTDLNNARVQKFSAEGTYPPR